MSNIDMFMDGERVTVKASGREGVIEGPVRDVEYMVSFGFGIRGVYNEQQLEKGWRE